MRRFLTTYHEKNGGSCRSCQAPLRWGRHVTTSRMHPFNLDGTSHFATCPNASEFRRRDAARDVTAPTITADDPTPELRQKRDAGGSGAAAAVAVIEAARRHLILHREVHHVDGCRCSGGLEDAIASFDRAMGVAR